MLWLTEVLDEFRLTLDEHIRGSTTDGGSDVKRLANELVKKVGPNYLLHRTLPLSVSPSRRPSCPLPPAPSPARPPTLLPSLPPWQ